MKIKLKLKKIIIPILIVKTPEFTCENFPIITVKCDNPNHRHNDINNLNKEEFIRNINEIIGNFGHILKSENLDWV